MRYEIKGGAFPIVVCNLESGEKMITERGSMVWMSPNMQMETRGGGLGKMFAKAFAGESMFQNIYTARGAGMITFGSSFPGQIKAINIGPGQEMIVQKSAFLASEAGVELSIHFKKKLGVGFFGGEGFIMQRLSGNGVAFVEIDGELVEYDLQPGEQLVVDTGNVAGFTPGVQMDIQQVPGMKLHAALHACTTMNENEVQCSAASVKILVHGTRSAFFAATSARMKLVLLSC